MILIQTRVEVVVNGKVVESDGSTIECQTREEAKAMLSRMSAALLLAEYNAVQPGREP